jgi:hypothetical protein
MTSHEDWHLPDNHWVEHHNDGRVTLWLDERAIRDFRTGTARDAIEAWTGAYAAGRTAGEAYGRSAGRRQLAAEFRNLL